MASLFSVKNPSDVKSRTFYNDEKLPPLPVPKVEDTIEKYLDSCKAILSDEDFQKTELICQKFVEKESKVLQAKLLHRAATNRNWLEKWWLDKAYLETRTPLPLQNFSGPGTYCEDVWPLKEGIQFQRAALNMYTFASFWNIIRNEMMAPHISDGNYLSMQQFRYLFNTCRIPKRGRDELLHLFKTKAEGGGSPTHVIVLCRGYVFKVDAVDQKTGELTTPPQYCSMLKVIDKICKNRRAHGPSLSALTGLNRDDWADARQHLVQISASNEKLMNEIESALFVTALENLSPQNYSEICQESVVGDPGLRWYDKSYTSSTFLNGAVMCNCDHTPYDAMVIVALVEFISYSLHQINGVWPGEVEATNYDQPVELKFDLDKQTLDTISYAKQQLLGFRNNLEVLQPVFGKFGKAALKQVQVHPDFMVQLCLQLAYIHVHGEPGPTYETAMTRQFYHGRTETCRTCTPEVVACCRAVLAKSLPGSDEYRQLVPLLRKAQSKFLASMKDCTLNKGCDRHLLGLLLICVENNLPIPELYTDKAFTATGGNGNFVLSTSCVGYMKGQGAVAPMLENGYGFFYRINNHKIVYSISAYNSCSSTSAQQMSDCFQYYMCTVMHILKEDAYSSKM